MRKILLICVRSGTSITPSQLMSYWEFLGASRVPQPDNLEPDHLV